MTEYFQRHEENKKKSNQRLEKYQRIANKNIKFMPERGKRYFQLRKREQPGPFWPRGRAK